MLKKHYNYYQKTSKNSKMSFERLPKVLKSIVCNFAFRCNWEQTSASLEMCDKIKKYNISPLFLRLQMWSKDYQCFMPSPLSIFEPIERFTDRWRDLVDWHAVNELLFRFDYRRSFVKYAGSRHDWFVKFRDDWTTVRLFDAFYRVLLHSGIKCFKPTYEVQRMSQLSDGHSPFRSARWLLADYC